MRYLILLVVFAWAACSQPTTSEQNAEQQTVSFSGTPLYTRPADSLATIKNDSVVQAIRAKAELSEDDYVALGRSLVSVGQFRQAVDAFTEGLAKYPNSFKILRYRGHRYINLRQLDNAITDLNRAEELIRPEQPVWETDSTGPSYQHNIWYHIGIYHFMKRGYPTAAEAFEKSLATAYAGNDKAGASDWLYNSYMRAGEKEKAAAVAKPFTADFDIANKDYPYYRRLLLFNGVIQPSELVDENKALADMTLNDMTKLYGLANYYRYAGDTQKAKALYEKVLQSNQWPGFAYACAELDVKE